MYDYNNGRFLSVDPFIQSPGSTQSLNPYTYIFNNPLSGIDPSGYTAQQEPLQQGFSLNWQSASLPANSGKVADHRSEGGKKKINLDGSLVGSGASNGKASISVKGTNVGNSDPVAQAIEDIGKQDFFSDLPNNHDPGSQAAIRIDALNRAKPVSSPVPIQFPTADGKVVTLVLTENWRWEVLDDGQRGWNKYQIGSDGVARFDIHAQALDSVDEVFDVATIGLAFAVRKTGQKVGETFFRTMSTQDHKALLATGRLPATSETFITTSKQFAEAYDGVLVQFTMKPGTTKALEKIGVRDLSGAVKARYPNMPLGSKGWKPFNAYFKKEGDNINIGLGNGKALEVFNNGIKEFN